MSTRLRADGADVATSTARNIHAPEKFQRALDGSGAASLDAFAIGDAYASNAATCSDCNVQRSVQRHRRGVRGSDPGVLGEA